MATGKQINELTQAGSVGASDVVAIAQSGNTEATKASMTQLAQAIAQINETGALAELVYATSQGKALLAQYLTEKGLPTEASETLIQMADKVDTLTVDSDVQNILVRGITAHTFSSATGEGNYLLKTIGPDNDFLLIACATGDAYYVPNGMYWTIEQMITAAISTIATGLAEYQSQYANLIITQSGQHAWWRGKNQKYCRIDIDPETKQLTNATVLTCPFTTTDTTYSNWFAADDNGILWINTGRGCYGQFWNTNNNWYTSTGFYLGRGSSQPGELTGPSFMNMMDNKIFYIMNYAGASYSYTLKYVPYTVDADTGEVSSSSYVLYNDENILTNFIQYHAASKILVFSDNTFQITETATNVEILHNWYLLSLDGEHNPVHIYSTELFPITPGSSSAITISYPRQCAIKENENGNYDISFFGLPNAVTYNPQTKQFTDNYYKKLLVHSIQSSQPSSNTINAGAVQAMMLSNDGYRAYVFVGASPVNNGPLYYKNNITYTSYDNLIGIKREKNNYLTYYLADNITEARVAGGAYAINTTITPSVPDEA